MLAYSYIRWSSGEQAKGDSLRRQMAASSAYCEKHGWTLDQSLNLRDFGVSAFRGKNATAGSLAAFLEAIKQGRVKAGSVLLVESLDRLSRSAIMDALRLFSSILESGVKIITLSPERVYTRDSVNDIAGLLEPIIIMARAHEESAIKSRRSSANWEGKRNRLSERKITGMCPHWLKLSEDRTRFVPVASKVATVQRIFQMAADGHGIVTITSTLNREGIKPIGKTNKCWHTSYIAKILANRAVLGEFQPKRAVNGKRVAVGSVVADYYPAIITSALWYRAQNGKEQRKTFAGRKGAIVTNLFSGLLRCRQDGETMRIMDKGKRAQKMLVSNGAVRGQRGSEYVGFPYKVFEFAFLAMVQELQTSELSSAPTNTEDQITTLAGQVSELDSKIRTIKNRIVSEPDFTSLIDVLAQLERSRKDTVALLEKVKASETQNAADELAQAKDYCELYDEATTDEERSEIRTKLRNMIRALVREIWMHVIKVDRYHRRAEISVVFHNDHVRLMLVDTKKELAASEAF